MPQCIGVACFCLLHTFAKNNIPYFLPNSLYKKKSCEIFKKKKKMHGLIMYSRVCHITPRTVARLTICLKACAIKKMNYIKNNKHIAWNCKSIINAKPETIFLQNGGECKSSPSKCKASWSI